MRIFQRSPFSVFGAVIVSCVLCAAEDTRAEGAEFRRHSGFSGLPYFVPRQSRLTLYKYRALANKHEGEANDLESAQYYTDQFSEGVIIPGSAVNDCSINIGNIFTDGTTGNFGDKENVVIIDGDVVNAGRCD